MTTPEEEFFLKQAGWVIHSKEGRRKFWESPHDKKVYPTTLALAAQRVMDAEARQQAQADHILKDMEDLKDLDKFQNWEVDPDELWPPPKKKKVKKKKEKRSTAQNIKQLGF